ncbi:MAG: sigma-70 family RNA polymerase sigma factor [Planctomycetaceae bacterium]
MSCIPQEMPPVAEPDSREPESDLRQLLLRARAGDGEALNRVLDLYGNDLLRVVRRRLPRPVRKLYDSEDFVQAVWATFLCHDIDPAAFDSSERLLAYLRRIAANKVSDQIRQRFATQKTCVDREVSLDGVGDSRIAASSGATASQVAIAHERLERLLRDQPAHYRRLIELKVAGAGTAEIAKELGLNPGTVRRILARIAERVAP